MQDRLGEADATLEAFRQRVDWLFHDALEMEPPDRVVEPLLAMLALELAHVGDELQKLVNGHLAIARRAFRQITEHALRLQRLLLDVVSADHRTARRRREKTREHLHRRRFAGAVRAEEAEHLSGLDAKTDAVDGDEVAVAFHELSRFYHGPIHLSV